MHVSFFTKPNMAIFIFCFIVIAYILPSVFTLLTQLLFFCKKRKPNKTKIRRNKDACYTCYSFIPAFLTVRHRFSSVGLFYFLIYLLVFYQRYALKQGRMKAAQLSGKMHNANTPSLLLFLTSSIATFVIVQLMQDQAFLSFSYWMFAQM